MMSLNWILYSDGIIPYVYKAISRGKDIFTNNNYFDQTSIFKISLDNWLKLQKTKQVKKERKTFLRDHMASHIFNKNFRKHGDKYSYLFNF